MNTNALLGILTLVAAAVLVHLAYHFVPMLGDPMRDVMAGGHYFASIGMLEVGIAAAISSATLFSMGIVALLFETAA